MNFLVALLAQGDAVVLVEDVSSSGPGQLLMDCLARFPTSLARRVIL